MSHRCFAYFCPSRDAALLLLEKTYFEDDASCWDDEPEFIAVYCVPLFWLAPFSVGDALIVRSPKSMDTTSPDDIFVAPCVATERAVERLVRRKTAILSLLPPALGDTYSDLYDQWVRIVDGHKGEVLVLDAFDIMTMGHLAPESLNLLKAIATIEAADSRPVTDEHGLFGRFSALPRFDVAEPDQDAERIAYGWRVGLVGGGDEHWPPEPGEVEIRFVMSQQ